MTQETPKTQVLREICGEENKVEETVLLTEQPKKLSKALEEKWKAVLDIDDLAKIDEKHRLNVTPIVL